MIGGLADSGLIGLWTQVLDRRLLAELAQGDLAIEGRRPARCKALIFLDSILTAGQTGSLGGPDGGSGPDPGVLGRVQGDTFEGLEGRAEIIQSIMGKGDSPPVADLAAQHHRTGQVVIVQSNASGPGGVVFG